MEFELQREMYEHQHQHQHQHQQHFVDSEDNGGSCFEDRKSTNLNLERPSSSLSNRSGSSSNNVDTVLLKDLAEMVPLVESLMDRRPKSSFTRRSSVIYTKTPSKETYPKKQVTESKVRKKVVQPQPVPARKPRECCAHNHQHKGSCTNELTTFKSRSSADELTTSKPRSSGTDKDRKDVVILQERMANLQNELLEKDELLKSAETSMNEMAALQAKLEELKRQAAEKDSLIKTAHLQISDAKMKLADKQTTVEKLQWEAMTSKEKVEKLQEDLDSMSIDVSAFMLLFEGLEKSNSTSNDEVYETTPYELDQLPPIYDIDEIQMRQMEEVRKAYIAAVTTAKENQDEESVILAAKARLLLQSFVLGPKNVTNPMMQENNCVIVS